MNPIKTLKAELKELAKRIREVKPQFRNAQSACDRKVEGANASKKWQFECDLGKARHEFRHKHIAYCMLRGRTLAQIETTKRCADVCYCCNKPDMKYVVKLTEAYRVPEQTLCVGTA